MANNLDPSNPGDNNEDDQEDPPRTPRLKLKDEDTEPLCPDTEEHVMEQTDGIFRNFVYQMYTNCQERDSGSDDTPDMPELTAFPEEPFG